MITKNFTNFNGLTNFHYFTLFFRFHNRNRHRRSDRHSPDCTLHLRVPLAFPPRGHHKSSLHPKAASRFFPSASHTRPCWFALSVRKSHAANRRKSRFSKSASPVVFDLSTEWNRTTSSNRNSNHERIPRRNLFKHARQFGRNIVRIRPDLFGTKSWRSR